MKKGDKNKHLPKSGAPAPPAPSAEKNREQERRELLPKEIQAKILSGYYRPADLENYSKTFELYLRGKAVGWQEAKLEKLGWIKLENQSGKAEPSLADVDICDSADELARRMMLHFQNPDKSNKLAIEITKQTISDWKAHRRLASTIPPFPTIKGGRTRYSLRAAIEWFNNHLWHDHRANPDQTNGAAANPFVPIGELRLVAERAELEKTLFDIEVAKGGYLATKKTEAIVGGTMRQYHDFLKGLLENVSPELFEVFWQGIGLTPEQITASKDFQVKEYRRIIDELELEAERRASENTDRIQSQVKHDLGK